MRKIIAALLLFSYTSLTNAQNPSLEWALSLEEDIIVTSIALDNAGNLYSTGRFNGTIDFDPGAGVTTLTSDSTNTTLAYDIFIQKLDPLGNLLWVKRVGGVGYDYGQSIAADAVGNVYVTGSFSNSVDFDPGPASTILSSNGPSDAFILKLNTLGNFVWARTSGGTNNNRSSSVALDNTGHIYISGHFNGTVDFDPGTGITNLTSIGNSDIFIQKLDTNGVFSWAKSIGHRTNNLRFNSMCIDDMGNFYLMGTFQDTVDFDPGTQINNLNTTFNGPMSNIDVYILKLNSNGNFLWVKQFKGNLFFEAITFDNGTLYITGAFSSTVDFDPNSGVMNLTGLSTDLFVLNLSSTGNFGWVKQFKGGAFAIPNSITTDTNGDVYLTGSFAGSFNFDPGTGITYLTSAGNKDIFNLKLDSTGNLIWVVQMGNTNNDEGFDIKVDNNNNVFSMGEFRGMVDFDPSTAQNNHFAINGKKKYYYQKLRERTVGLVKNTFEEPIQLYPNPTQGDFFIQLGQVHHSINARFIDVSGRLIWEKEFAKTNLLELNVEGKPGLYFIEIENNLGDKATFKIIKNE